MSTTEQPAAPSMTTHVSCQDGGTHVWTDEDGRTHGALYLEPHGVSSLNFHDVSQVRDLIGRLAALAGEMETEIRRQRPAEVVPLPEPERESLACMLCGATDVPLLGDAYGWVCNESHRCAERVAAQDAAEAAQVAR